MDKKIKCTYCGNSDLFLYDLQGHGYEDNASFKGFADIFVCRQCRHIEWFLSEGTMQSFILQEQRSTKYNNKVEKVKKERIAVQKQIDSYQKIVDDENQTVKSVNVARAKIESLQEKLDNLIIPDVSHLPGGIGRQVIDSFIDD